MEVCLNEPDEPVEETDTASVCGSCVVEDSRDAKGSGWAGDPDAALPPQHGFPQVFSFAQADRPE
jgi:hypothetical protein